jgi:malate synthase
MPRSEGEFMPKSKVAEIGQGSGRDSASGGPRQEIPAYWSFVSPEVIQASLAQALPISARQVPSSPPEQKNPINSRRVVGESRELDAPKAPNVSKVLEDLRRVPSPQAPSDSENYETPDALIFACSLYDAVKTRLAKVLDQRAKDRQFLDERVRACVGYNRELGISWQDPDYCTPLALTDAEGRTVFGPLPTQKDFTKPQGRPVAPLPPHLQGTHVTLFGPPESVKLSINAMNATHRKLPGEPAIVAELLNSNDGPSWGMIPKWGADDEDSKTPLPEHLLSAGLNLKGCYEGTLKFQEASLKTYEIHPEKRALPIKRIPGLALPSLSHFYRGQPLPLHLYDLALHLVHHWEFPERLTFYIPKLENEEEAAYLAHLLEQAESLLKQKHPKYQVGGIRVILVIENPRAVFRLNEMIDALHPYFAGASLGWHDYLASTARLHREDPNYRIPVKTDPNIVIKHIKGAHELLVSVVGGRGGVAIGGMYGVLPTSAEVKSPSFQITLRGFFKDVLTQLRRGLDGFWVAHPDFVRLGLALTVAWRQHARGETAALKDLIEGLFSEPIAQELLAWLRREDVTSFSTSDPLYSRYLLAHSGLEGGTHPASKSASQGNVLSNHDLEEVRYNVFQALQYLTDWLVGGGCVALPALIEGVPVRVMDDLATAERSRWEVWAEVRHGRVSEADLVRVIQEELRLIRKHEASATKQIQVRWDERTARWYPVAAKLLLCLMTQRKPVEFATEILLPFTMPLVREAEDPWSAVTTLIPERTRLLPRVQRLLGFFEACGCQRFAEEMSQLNLLEAVDPEAVDACIESFSREEILEAASFHGDIGEQPATLDAHARQEQARAQATAEGSAELLRDLGKQYLNQYGFKFLISAKGKSAAELLEALKARLLNPQEVEEKNAKQALSEIAKKRLGIRRLQNDLDDLRIKHQVAGVSLCLTQEASPGTALFGLMQELTLGVARLGGGESAKVRPSTGFEIASLSKTLGSCIALEIFRKHGLGLDTQVNPLLAKLHSPYRIQSLNCEHPEWAEKVTLKHLVNHSALNSHYVNGVPHPSADRAGGANHVGNVGSTASAAGGSAGSAGDSMNRVPGTDSLSVLPWLFGDESTGASSSVGVIQEPGKGFRYSGGGFLVLEHLVECLEGKITAELTSPFLQELLSLGRTELAKLSAPSPFSLGLTFDPLPELSASVQRGCPPEENKKTQWDWSRAGIAHGVLSNQQEVPGGRYLFPAFAAGAIGTASGVSWFLQALTKAYHQPEGYGPIHQETAVALLGSPSPLSMDFMGVHCGLGVFVAEAGENRFAVHQGANDGFRALFAHAFEGPDRGSGFVILCNADENGVEFVGKVAQKFLTLLRPEGVRTHEWSQEWNQKNELRAEGVPEEERVNRGYKELVFKYFEPDLPKAIQEKGPIDPLSVFNVAVGAKIEGVTNQRFARAENLIGYTLPSFDPTLYERQGKVMDSWETARHNPRGSDAVTLRLAHPSRIDFVSLSTQFHLGNHAPQVAIEGLPLSSDGSVATRASRSAPTPTWRSLLPRVRLQGHSLLRIRLPQDSTVYERVRVLQFPDGGLSRLGLYCAAEPKLPATRGDLTPEAGAESQRVSPPKALPAEIQADFLDLDKAVSLPFSDPIPAPQRPLVMGFVVSTSEVEKNWERILKNMVRPTLVKAQLPEHSLELEVASAAWGGRVVSASNEHYSPAIQCLSPFPPLHMFDGFESARSRLPQHSEELILELGAPTLDQQQRWGGCLGALTRVVLDFTYFRNNNPVAIEVFARSEEQAPWSALMPKTEVKGFAGRRFEWRVEGPSAQVAWVVEPSKKLQLRFCIHPDGGINRIRIYRKWLAKVQ